MVSCVINTADIRNEVHSVKVCFRKPGDRAPINQTQERLELVEPFRCADLTKKASRLFKPLLRGKFKKWSQGDSNSDPLHAIEGLNSFTTRKRWTITKLIQIVAQNGEQICPLADQIAESEEELDLESRSERK